MNPFGRTTTSPLNNPKDIQKEPVSIFGKPTIFDPPTKRTEENRSNSIGVTNPWGGNKSIKTEQNVNKPFTPPNNTSIFPSIFPNQNGNEIYEQLRLRDNRIEHLESQIKLLTETVTLCVKTINEMKSQNQTHYQNQKTIEQPPTNISPLIPSIFPVQPNPQSNFTQKLGKVVHKSENEIIFQEKEIYIYLEVNTNPESAKNVKIENEFAKIIFKENVNLQSIKSNLSEWIEMNSSNVKIKVPELKAKKCDIFIKDFHQFTKCLTPQKQQEIYDQVSKAKEDPKFETVEFDCTSGMLYTKCRGL